MALRAAAGCRKEAQEGSEDEGRGSRVEGRGSRVEGRGWSVEDLWAATCSRSALRNAGKAQEGNRSRTTENGASVEGCRRCSRRSTLAPRRTLLQVAGTRFARLRVASCRRAALDARPSPLDARCGRLAGVSGFQDLRISLFPSILDPRHLFSFSAFPHFPSPLPSAFSRLALQGGFLISVA